MIFTSAAIFALIVSPACGRVDVNSELAPHLVATVETESGGDQYAIGINADVGRNLPASKETARTARDAIDKATTLLAQGRHIDLGLMQISDRQLARHRLTVATVFDECSNVRAGAEHLADDYAWTLAHRRYNCGSITCGIVYADRVTAKIGTVEAVRLDTSAADATVPPCPEPDPAGWHVTATPRDCTVEQAWHAIPQQKDPR